MRLPKDGDEELYRQAKKKKMIDTKIDLKTELRNILGRHEGRDRAITGKELAQMLSQHDDREIRLIIRDLIMEGLPVASTTKEPAGYFIITSWQEKQEYAESLKERLIQNALRRKDFRRAADYFLNSIEQRRLL